MTPPRMALTHAQMLAVRDSVDPAGAYESYFHDAIGEPAVLRDAGTVRDPSHCYVLLGDGTIADPTLEQFYPGGRGNTTGDWTAAVWERLPSSNPCPGQVAVIAPAHQFARHYLSRRARHDSWMYPDGYWRTGREPAWWHALHA